MWCGWKCGVRKNLEFKQSASTIMGRSFRSYPCPECARMIWLVRKRAADAGRPGVTCNDPMQRRDLWNLLNSELQPPREFHWTSAETERSQ